MFSQLLPLKNPQPDFHKFANVIKGKEKSRRVHFVELLVDPEIIEFVSKNMMGVKIPSLRDLVERRTKKINRNSKINLLMNSDEKFFWEHYIRFYYQMGYDYVPDIGILLMHGSIIGSILPRVREAKDTSMSLSRGKRTWAEEGKGIITCWQDFESFPWEVLDLEVEEYYRFLDHNLSDGMKIIVEAGLYEQIMERIMGYENLFYLLYDESDLVKAVFNKLGDIIYRYYKKVVSLDCVGAIFHADDLGFKTSTMLSPDVLRELFFPWLKRYTSLAHNYGKMFWYHCCGYKDEIMKDLIEDVGIDALHSFEDACCPITEYKRKYGDRIALLGGVDMDKLCRLDQEHLRRYVRYVLDTCTRGGKYALGSGNSVANYMPVRNYLTMLEEGLKWGEDSHFY